MSINPASTPMPGGGYIVGFGNHEPGAESLDQQRARLQHRAGRDIELREDEDIGENDWSVSYADMVTLLMAFFIILTAVTVKVPVATVGVKADAQHETLARPSPFDGQGITIAEMGMPANQDDVVSQYDDPEANGATTDPSPSGEAFTANTQSPQPELTVEEPQAPLQPEPPPPVPANPLAEQLQQMVQQNDLAGQVEVISGAQSVTVRISDRILFASGKALLEDGGRTLVQRLSTILASTGGVVSIEGHTDNIPISTLVYPSNWELSAARAAMVVRELVALGLPSNRLRAIGYADTKPVASNADGEGRASNRRVELVITSDAAKP